MMNRNKLYLQKQELEQVKTILAPLLERNIPVWVFGSRVTGEVSRSSDLDIVILPEKPLPLAEYYHLKDEFEYSDLPFRVDLLDWNRISPEFQESIKKSYIVIA